MEEQFPAFTVDERACSDPCQIEAQRITVQHESKQNNRIGKKMLEVQQVNGKSKTSSYFLISSKQKSTQTQKTKSKDNFIPFIRSLAIVYREVGFGVECLIGNHNNANGDNCNQNPPHQICSCRQYNTKRDKSERKRTKVKERRKQNVVEALLVALI